MTDKEIFLEYYRARIELTDRVAINRPITITQLSQLNQIPENVSYTEERVIAIYIPESLANELITDSASEIKEAQIRKRDSRLYKLWHEYKMWLNLIR